MEDLPEATKVSWDGDSGSLLEDGQRTPVASPSSPQSDPYSPPAPFPAPHSPPTEPDENHGFISLRTGRVISLDIDDSSYELWGFSDSADKITDVDFVLEKLIKRFNTVANASKRAVLITALHGIAYGMAFAFDHTATVNISRLDRHTVNFLRCSVLYTPRLPDLETMRVLTAFLPRSTSDQLARLRADPSDTRDPDKSPIKFRAGFDNRAFSRSARLNPDDPKKIEMVRYELEGTITEFESYCTGYGASKREREAWGALIRVFDSSHYTSPLSPGIDYLATDFYNGNPVQDSAYYAARFVHDNFQDRGPSQSMNHVVTYRSSTMSDILGQDILKHDMVLSQFLLDSVMNARLQEYQDDSEGKIIKVHDLVFWVNPRARETTPEATESKNVEGPTAAPGTPEASDLLSIPIDELVAAIEASTDIHDSKQAGGSSAAASSSRNANKNSKKREKAKAKAAAKTNNGEGASTTTDIAESGYISETALGGLIPVQEPAQVDSSSVVKKVKSVDESQLSAAPKDKASPLILDLSKVQHRSVDTQKSSHETAGHAPLSGAPHNGVRGELNAANLAAFGDVNSPSRSEFKREDFNSLYDVSNDGKIAEWNVVQSKSSKKAIKQNKSYQSSHSEAKSASPSRDNDRSGDNSLRINNRPLVRCNQQPKDDPKNTVKSPVADSTTEFNLNMEEYPPLSPASPMLVKQEPAKELRVAKKALERPNPQYSGENDAGKIKSAQMNIDKSDTGPKKADQNDSGKINAGKNAATKNNADDLESDADTKNENATAETGSTTTSKNKRKKRGKNKSKRGSTKAESSTRVEPSPADQAVKDSQSFSTQLTDGPSTVQELDDSFLTEKHMMSAESTDTNDAGDGKSESSDAPKVFTWTSVAIIKLLLGPSEEARKILSRHKSKSVSDVKALMEKEDAAYDAHIYAELGEVDPSTQRSRAGSIADVHYTSIHSKLSEAYRTTQKPAVQHSPPETADTVAVQQSPSDSNATVVQHPITNDDREQDASNETLSSIDEVVVEHTTANDPSDQDTSPSTNKVVVEHPVVYDPSGQETLSSTNEVIVEHPVANDSSALQHLSQQPVYGLPAMPSPAIVFHPTGNLAEYNPIQQNANRQVVQQNFANQHFASQQFANQQFTSQQFASQHFVNHHFANHDFVDQHNAYQHVYNTQQNSNQNSVSTIGYVHTQYPANSSIIPGTAVIATHGGASASHAQITQRSRARNSLPAAFAVCTYCMTLPSGGPESQVTCPGCGPDHYVRYCSVACLLADALEHGPCCLRRPVPPRVLDADTPQNARRSLTPLSPASPATIETPERFRQRTFNVFCSSGPFPEILAAWARKMKIDLQGVVNGTDWFKKTGDYAIFRSESTGLPGRYNPQADVIFTVVLQMNDPRKQYLVRVLNACFVDPRMELVVFLFRTILALLNDPEFYRLTKYYEIREIVVQEFMVQFEREWCFNPSSWVNSAPFDYDLEWLWILRTLRTIEHQNPILDQAWKVRYQD